MTGLGVGGSFFCLFGGGEGGGSDRVGGRG